EGACFVYSVGGHRDLHPFPTRRSSALDGERQGLRFGASGDVRGDLAPYPAIANAPGRDLDFFVHLGDTVYADFPSPAVPKQAQTPEEFRQKYVEVHSTYRGSNTLAALRAAAPFYVTLEDRKSTRLNSSHVKISNAVFCF